MQGSTSVSPQRSHGKSLEEESPLIPPAGSVVKLGLPGDNENNETFMFKANEFIMVIGSSGSGKTTFIGTLLALVRDSLLKIGTEVLFVSESLKQRFFEESLPIVFPEAILMTTEEFISESLSSLPERTNDSPHMLLILDDVLIAANPKERQNIVAVLLQQTKRLQHANLTLWITLHGEVDKMVKNFAELKAAAFTIVYPVGTGPADINGLSQAAVDVKFRLSPELREDIKTLVGRLKRRIALRNEGDETDNLEKKRELYKKAVIACNIDVIIISKNNNTLYDGITFRQLRIGK